MEPQNHTVEKISRHKLALDGKQDPVFTQLGSSAEQPLQMLDLTYPEFRPLADETLKIASLHDTYRQRWMSLTRQSPRPEGPASSIVWNQVRVLSGYMGALSMYFAFLTLNMDQSRRNEISLSVLKQYRCEVMQRVIAYRELWADIKDNAELGGKEAPVRDDYQDAATYSSAASPARQQEFGKTASENSTSVPASSQLLEAARAQEAERALSDLSKMTAVNVLGRGNASSIRETGRLLGDSGQDNINKEEQHFFQNELSDKQSKRKSLRFHTTKLSQKMHGRARALETRGGDEDIPHHESFRARQDKSRGKANDDLDAASISQESDGGDFDAARSNADTFSDGKRPRPGAQVVSQDTGELATDYVQIVQEGGIRQERVTEPDERREIGFAIEKNRGLASRRQKINRNPRVKKRKRFEDKSKKLRSMRPSFAKGEGTGGYRGELTGIKSKLVKSIKL